MARCRRCHMAPCLTMCVYVCACVLFVCSAATMYDRQAYQTFRDADLRRVAIEFAAAGRVLALAVMLSSHPQQVLPYRLSVLGRLPETMDPRVYADVLPCAPPAVLATGGGFHAARTSDGLSRYYCMPVPDVQPSSAAATTEAEAAGGEHETKASDAVGASGRDSSAVVAPLGSSTLVCPPFRGVGGGDASTTAAPPGLDMPALDDADAWATLLATPRMCARLVDRLHAAGVDTAIIAAQQSDPRVLAAWCANSRLR